LLVRTWNLFHGNASPPERRAFLEEMVRLAVDDRPDIVCLQELPVWSLGHLESWSGMRAVADVTARPLLGSAELGRMITDVNHGLFRSAFTGQANAVLLVHAFSVKEHQGLVLNPSIFRRREVRRLRLTFGQRCAWKRNRRVCQVLRLARDDATLAVCNLHASGLEDKRVADAELVRAATFVDGFADPREPIVLAGDFNVTAAASRALTELAEPEWGFEGATGSGIDHILARGLRGTLGAPWPVGRRTVDGRVLSDHAPVDRELG
jgi:endonuclease/exonuclease/phosphatase family metal-dependent hydrolase